MRGLEGRVGWCKVSWRHEMVWLCWCKVRVWRGEGGSVCLRGGRRSGSLNSNSQTGVIVSVLIPGGPHSTNSILEKLRPHEFAQSITIFYYTNCQLFCHFKCPEVVGKKRTNFLSSYLTPYFQQGRGTVDFKEAYEN